MEYQLVWTNEAHSTLEQLIAGLDEINPQAGDNLIMQLDKCLSLIARMPHMYAATSQKPAVRRCLINRHTALYYRINGQLVELLSFFDTRQNPTRLDL